MTNSDGGMERRIYSRVDIEKDASGTAAGEFIEGAVADVSIGGIALRTDAELELGQQIVLEIEGMSRVFGEVFRVTDQGFVVSLDLPRDDEKKFIAEVMKIQNNLEIEI